MHPDTAQGPWECLQAVLSLLANLDSRTATSCQDPVLESLGTTESTVQTLAAEKGLPRPQCRTPKWWTPLIVQTEFGDREKDCWTFCRYTLFKGKGWAWAGEPDLKVLRAKATGTELGKSQGARQNNSRRLGGHSPPLPWSQASPVPSGTTRKESRPLSPLLAEWAKGKDKQR